MTNKSHSRAPAAYKGMPAHCSRPSQLRVSLLPDAPLAARPPVGGSPRGAPAPGEAVPSHQLHPPVEDGFLLLLVRAGTAQDPLSGLCVLCLPLCEGLDRKGRPAGGVWAADHAVAGGPLEDADLRRGPRGKAIVLDHNGHFGRRLGFPADRRADRCKVRRDPAGPALPQDRPQP